MAYLLVNRKEVLADKLQAAAAKHGAQEGTSEEEEDLLKSIAELDEHILEIR